MRHNHREGDNHNMAHDIVHWSHVIHDAVDNLDYAHNDDTLDLDVVRAVYDAAAHILNDAKPVVDTVASAVLWQLRAAYIDTHAACNQHPNHGAHTAVRAARDALVAATAPANGVTP
jgi:hypothetical protein